MQVFNYIPVRERSILIVSVCPSVCRSISVCVRGNISATTHPIFTDFCACYLWPWLGPPLAALRWAYVMYFRCYE